MRVAGPDSLANDSQIQTSFSLIIAVLGGFVAAPENKMPWPFLSAALVRATKHDSNSKCFVPH